MDRNVQRGAGALFAAGGAALFVTGLLHPRGDTGDSFHGAISRMMLNSHWPAAHWLAIAAAVPTAWALWLLIDGGWTKTSGLAHAGARLTQIGLAILTVEFAVEIASHAAADAYAGGQAVPMVALVDPLQVIGFPAFGFGIGLLALGLRGSTPRALAVLAALGGAVTGVGAVVTMGLHEPAAGATFMGLQLPTLWMVWAGVRLALSAKRVSLSPSLVETAAA